MPSKTLIPWGSRRPQRSGKYPARPRQRATADDPLQTRGMGRGQCELARRNGRALPVRALSTSGEDARRGTCHLPARKPDALVPHRRPRIEQLFAKTSPTVLPRQASQPKKQGEDSEPSLPKSNQPRRKDCSIAAHCSSTFGSWTSIRARKIPGPAPAPLAKLDG